jgi:hypothetical protein
MIAEQKDNNQEIRDSKVVFGFQYWHTWNSAQLSLSGLASPASSSGEDIRFFCFPVYIFSGIRVEQGK